MTLIVVFVVIGAIHAPVFAVIYRMAREGGVE